MARHLWNESIFHLKVVDGKSLQLAIRPMLPKFWVPFKDGVRFSPKFQLSARAICFDCFIVRSLSYTWTLEKNIKANGRYEPIDLQDFGKFLSNFLTIDIF